jgi:hypothetical protein
MFVWAQVLLALRAFRISATLPIRIPGCPRYADLRITLFEAPNTPKATANFSEVKISRPRMGGTTVELVSYRSQATSH